MVDKINRQEMSASLRTCPKCGITKSEDEFFPYMLYRCKECNRQYCRDYAKKNPRPYRKPSPESKAKKQAKAFKRRYGITEEERDLRFASQGFCCAICGDITSNGAGWCTDHDHACCPGKGRSCGACIRGILCFRCNTMLGHARDNINNLMNAVAYLENWEAGRG